MHEVYLSVHARDLMDEGADSALGRIRGELGVDGISIPVFEPNRFRVRPRHERPMAAPESGSCFLPKAEFYSRTRIRPSPARWMKSRNLLGQIAEKAVAHGLRLRLRVACCDAPDLAERQPGSTCANAFDVASTRWLCPSNPDVRACLYAIVGDLSANYPASVIELADVEFGDLSEPWASQLHALPDMARHALSMCFCAACRERAAEDVDADQLADAIRTQLRALWANRENGPHHDGSEAMQMAMHDYDGVRKRAVLSLISGAKNHSRLPITVVVSPEGGAQGGTLEAIAENTDRVQVSRDRGCGAATAGLGIERIELAFGCRIPVCSSGPDLIKSMHEAFSVGHPAVLLEDYGMATDESLEWVRQAVRFAKREAAVH